MKVEGKFIVKVAGTLTAICLVVAALLGGVNAVTADKIDAINKANTEASLKAVASNATEFPQLQLSDAMTAAASSQGAKVTEAYEVKAGGERVGYAFKMVASGSQGNIEMIVGVDADNAVTGVSIVSNKETAGIGSKVMSNNALPSGVGVLDQFIGSSGAGSLVVGKTVDAISGATVSSKGVTKGVNAALAVAEALG
ncbi:MAG: FMN-binding protein [Ruminococcaceae bacterium]|jgi:electron transport complex protein RnfG|nr:FMN-binding protein [Oscillospiraceae bacterium]